MKRMVGAAAVAAILGLAGFAPTALANEQMMMKKAHEGTSGALPAGKIEVNKATGPDAYTVSEVHARKGDLDKKKVVVRGKVVKVSAGIMDRNWVHLQDGSGTRETNDFNLVVTTQDLPKMGDVVTASGTLAKDRDFGMGYRYSVIVEGASVTP